MGTRILDDAGGRQTAVKVSRQTQEVEPVFKGSGLVSHQDIHALSDEQVFSSPHPQYTPTADVKADVPIFLWSTDLHSRGRKDEPSQSNRLSDRHFHRNAGSLQEFSGVPNPEKFIYSVTNDIHARLRTSKKYSPEFVAWYEQTLEQGPREVMDLLSKSKVLDGPQEDSDVSDDTSVIEQTINMLATDILYAFVPQGFDAPVVSRFWGALYKLLLVIVCHPVQSLRPALTHSRMQRC